jgi:ParB family chromosome partitioning protein
MIEEGSLSAGQARPLIGIEGAEEIAREIVAKGLSAREAEVLARKASTGSAVARRSSSSPSSGKDADTVALERNISEQLGLKVEIVHAGDKGGEVKVSYKTLDQLDEICRRLAGRGGPRISNLN